MSSWLPSRPNSPTISRFSRTMRTNRFWPCLPMASSRRGTSRSMLTWSVSMSFNSLASTGKKWPVWPGKPIRWKETRSSNSSTPLRRKRRKCRSLSGRETATLLVKTKASNGFWSQIAWTSATLTFKSRRSRAPEPGSKTAFGGNWETRTSKWRELSCNSCPLTASCASC